MPLPWRLGLHLLRHSRNPNIWTWMVHLVLFYYIFHKWSRTHPSTTSVSSSELFRNLSVGNLNGHLKLLCELRTLMTITWRTFFKYNMVKMQILLKNTQWTSLSPISDLLFLIIHLCNGSILLAATHCSCPFSPLAYTVSWKSFHIDANLPLSFLFPLHSDLVHIQLWGAGQVLASDFWPVHCESEHLLKEMRAILLAGCPVHCKAYSNA